MTAVDAELSRWWIPLGGLRPDVVALDHLHAVTTGWLDGDADHHDSKPYAITPLRRRTQGDVGFEIGILTSACAYRLAERLAGPALVRLGRQHGTAGPASLMRVDSWHTLADDWSGARTWRVTFHSPTLFRRRARSTPLPSAPMVIRSLSQSWSRWSPVPALPWTPDELEQVFVSDIDGRSIPAPIKVPGARSPGTYSGFVGEIVLRAPELLADRVSPLLAMAEFSGIGSFTGRGLGVARATAVMPR